MRFLRALLLPLLVASMAFRSISTNNAPATNLVVTPPAGIQDGDILVAWTVNDASTGATTWPSGFVEGASSPLSMSSWDASTFRYALKPASSESGNYTLTGATAVIGGVAAFSGRVQSTTPHRESGLKTDSGAASPFTITSAAFSSATSAEADILLIGVVDGVTPAGDVVFTAPTGYTKDADVCQTSTFERQFVFAHKDAVAAGETGSLSATGTLSGSSAARSAFAIALATQATAALTGTATAGITEADVVAGGKTITVTLSGDTFVPASVTPQIGYVGGQVAGRAGNTSTASVNFSLSGGDVGFASATPQAGDLVIITAVVGSQGRNPAQAISGYTALGQLNSAAATQDTSMNVSYKIMGATPDTSFTLPSTGNTADAQRYTIQVFRNIDPTTPLDVTPTSATGSATGRPNPPSITPVTSGAYVVICAGGGAGTGANYTAPANYTTNFLTGFTADTNDAMVGSGYRAWTAGAEDPASYTGGTTNATDSWAAYTLALRPAPATTPFADAIADFINGLDSAQSEATGWDAVVKAGLTSANVARTSDTVATVTLPAFGTYNITATETITDTIPGSILSSGSPITATPTFTISTSGGGGSFTLAMQDAALGFAVESPSLSQANTLALADARMTFAVDGPLSLTQANTLALNDVGMTFNVESPSLTQANILAPADARMTLAVESPSLVQANLLAVQDALLAFTVETPTLVQANVLAVADALMAFNVDAVTLGSGLNLALQDSLLALTAESPTLTTLDILAVQDALLSLAADPITLLQSYLLTVQDARLSFSVDSLLLAASGIAITAEVVALEEGWDGTALRLPGDVFTLTYRDELPAWVALNDGTIPHGSIGYGTEHRWVRANEAADQTDRVLSGYKGVRVRRGGKWVTL